MTFPPFPECPSLSLEVRPSESCVLASDCHSSPLTSLAALPAASLTEARCSQDAVLAWLACHQESSCENAHEIPLGSPAVGKPCWVARVRRPSKGAARRQDPLWPFPARPEQPLWSWFGDQCCPWLRLLLLPLFSLSLHFLISVLVHLLLYSRRNCFRSF